MSWEDEDFTPAKPGTKPVSDSWEDEDSNTSSGIQIKGSWEDEDVTTPEPAKPKAAEPKKPAAKPAPKKAVAKPTYVSSGDPLVDKMREQRLVEEADYQNVEDMFGLSKPEEKSGETDHEPDLLDQKPKTEAEFEHFAAQIAEKLSAHERSFNYPFFVKSLTKHLCTNFSKAEDIKDIITALNVLVNEKLKSEKPKPKQPKKAAGPTSGKKVYKDAFDDDFDTKGKNYDDEYDDFM
eukprot:Phypoly_transcript_16032.p1 GENE.Phypoly_transcript_16032~~Phypoly_transcript_16032.p1  ORF type:complete len:236 (+),score=67.63 Phypoly_transcript_16032:60-767(+)